MTHGRLVLTRTPGRSIFIGRGIIVTVVEVNGKDVRLSIEAPGNVAVTRDDFGMESHLTTQAERERKALNAADRRVP